MSAVSLLSLGDVHHHEAAFLSVLRNRGRNVHVERTLPLLQERHLALLFRRARKYFFKEDLETGTVSLVNENPKAPTH
jgi:hypothetical protein